MKIKSFINRILNLFKSKSSYSRHEFGAIGKHSTIGKGCVLAPRFMFLDDYVIIQNHVHFISAAGRLIVKKYSVISAQCIIVPGTHVPTPGVPFYFQTAQHIGDDHGEIIVEEDCWIGAGSTLLMKSHIGRGAIVAAGSVVTKPVPPYAVVAGCPAKIIAVKFSKEDILRHEQALYEPAERLTEDEIDSLFENHFRDLKVLECNSPEKVCGRYDREQSKFISEK